MCLKMEFLKSLFLLGVTFLASCNADGVFVTKAMDFAVLEYTSLTLECELTSQPPFGPLWKKDETIISHERTSLKKSTYEVEGTGLQYNLHIYNVTVDEEGDYSCQVNTATGEQVEQEHHITVNIPPAIKLTPETTMVDVELGEDFNVFCQSTGGKPEPTITWTKQEGSFSSGETTMETELLEIKNAQKNATGTYRCIGSNDAGVDKREISVYVRYAPTVEVVNRFIHTAPGQNVALVCSVKASPLAVIHWIFRKELVANMDNIEIENHIINDANISTLHVRNLKMEDLGVYKCQGRNDWGTYSKKIEVSGLPLNLTIVSKEESIFVNQYSLEWTVVSLPSIVEFRLSVKKVELQENGSEVFTHEETIRPFYNGNKDAAEIHHQVHIINGLERNSTYEVQLTASNVVGTSDLTERFIFHTPADGRVAEPGDSIEPTQVSAGSITYIQFGVVLLCALTIFL